ncbi:hypothetical protein ACFV7R_09075 [Streptomyces sp. NPDC059866]|uniref:hypothetical protein n=1 Tax=Streptomyces sp. NPDC059866 TaxID=3346978 RepID=UPI00366429CF
MTWLAPEGTCPLTGVFGEAGLPASATGESSGWAWMSHDALAVPHGGSVWKPARDITGFRYEGSAETVFLASTSVRAGSAPRRTAGSSGPPGR